MSETYISEAEEALVDKAEQPHLGAVSWAATNTLVFSHLIPARRFAEARLWCDDLIKMETGYESWNALSNLGIVEFESGNTVLARNYFKEIVNAGFGPVDEAQSYMDRIDAGEKHPLDKRVDWDYTDKWQKVDVSKPLKGKQKPKDMYLRMIKIMHVQNTWEEFKESYSQSPAATIFGYVNGVETALIEAAIEFEREVLVRACGDYIQFVVGEEAEQVRPGRVVEASNTPPRLNENDPEVISATSVFNRWCEAFVPVAYIAFELEEIPSGISNEFIWSEHSGAENDFLTPGFEPFAQDRDPATSYVITSVPFSDEDNNEFITTRIQRFCEECEGEGIVDDEECPGCDGDGDQNYEIPSNYPLIIYTQEELDAYTSTYSSTPSGASASAARFCTSCGSARPDGAKFCVSCGEKF